MGFETCFGWGRWDPGPTVLGSGSEKKQHTFRLNVLRHSVYKLCITVNQKEYINNNINILRREI